MRCCAVQVQEDWKGPNLPVSHTYHIVYTSLGAETLSYFVIKNALKLSKDATTFFCAHDCVFPCACADV